MLSRPLGWTFAIAAGFFALSGDFARGQQPPRVDVKRVETPTHTEGWRAKQVLGGKVMIEGNVSIGKVDDIVFAPDGYIEYLIVENEGKLVTVPWEAAKFNFQERSALVNITPDVFKKIPTYTIDKYPVFTTPTYRTDIYRFYGLTPRERRLERRLEKQ